MKHPARELQSYLIEELTAGSSLYSNPALLRVLFRKEIKLTREQHNEMVTFAFKQSSQPRAKIIGKPNSNLHLITFNVPNAQDEEEVVPSEVDLLDIDIVNVQKRESEVLKLLNYDVLTSENVEIDRQIKLWEKELFGL